MTSADYARYTLTEFLEDDYFIQWATARDERNDSFWKTFLAEYPDQEPVIREALMVIQVYRGQDTFTNDARIDAVWRRVDNTIGLQSESRFNTRPAWRYFGIAAAITLVCGAAYLMWHFSQDSMVKITTEYGEVKAITLPDQSIVMLNGNSSLTYRGNWSAASASMREVWIHGEAYFDVRHINTDTTAIKPSERFLVHGSDMDIAVLGTSFNVKSRRNKTNIALLTGKIEVTRRDEASAGLVLLPGDYVEYDGQELREKKKLLRPHKAATWTVREITFTDPTVADIVETLQDSYGYAISLGDQKLLEMKIEGEISVTSVSELLAVVSSTLGIKIEESGKQVTIMGK